MLVCEEDLSIYGLVGPIASQAGGDDDGAGNNTAHSWSDGAHSTWLITKSLFFLLPLSEDSNKMILGYSFTPTSPLANHWEQVDQLTPTPYPISFRQKPDVLGKNFIQEFEESAKTPCKRPQQNCEQKYNMAYYKHETYHIIKTLHKIDH